ncbi:N-acetylglucosaminyltransferase [Trebouxia sp. C0009 RCD-2024]
MCDGDAEKAASPIEGLFRDSNSVLRQKPYAYAFCLTSVHHLCTALINTVRLRKLHCFQEADIVALVPKSWGPIIQRTMRSNSMHDLQQWAVQAVQDPVTETTPESVRKLREQHKQPPIFQGVALADYDLVGMLARMIALGVVFRPSDVFEHLPGNINTTHHQREATSKLHLFGLIEYKQVLYLDADGLILQNLDAVFNLSATPLALLPKEVTGAEGEEYSTRLMLVQPSKAVQAQLQFVVEKDLDFNDARILSEFFSGQIQNLSKTMALQSYKLIMPNHDAIIASELLREALYVHLYDGAGLPRHWQWAQPSSIPKVLAICTELCDERMSWLHVYSMLARERGSLCLHQR